MLLTSKNFSKEHFKYVYKEYIKYYNVKYLTTENAIHKYTHLEKI